MKIDRCICTNTRFKEILETYYNYEAIESQTDIGSYCGLCIPYIKKMFKTQEVEFNYVIRE